MMDFRASDQRDEGLSLGNDEKCVSSLASAKEHGYGISLEHSLKTCSSVFSFPIGHSILFYSFTCLIKNGMMQMFSSDMLEDCNVYSSSVQKSSCSTPTHVGKGKRYNKDAPT